MNSSNTDTPRLLKKDQAVENLMAFLLLQNVMAAQEVMKMYGLKSLENGEFRLKSAERGGHPEEPCTVILNTENSYLASIEELRYEVQQMKMLTVLKNVTPLLNKLLQELKEFKIHLLDEHELTSFYKEFRVKRELNDKIALYNRYKDRPDFLKVEEVSAEEIELSRKEYTVAKKFPVWMHYADFLTENTFYNANIEKVDPACLKAYLDFVLSQQLKLLQLFYIEKATSPKFILEGNRNSYNKKRPLEAMFISKEVLIRFCEELVHRKYAEKIESGYKWKATQGKLVVFGAWLSERKERLFVQGEDFDNDKHKGAALCNFFMVIPESKRTKDLYQLFQDNKTKHALTGEFIFLEPLI